MVWSGSNKIDFEAKNVEEIHITASGYFFKMVNGKRVLGIEAGTSRNDMKSVFETIADGSFPFITMIKQNNDIKLAGNLDTAKETVRLSFGKVNGQRII